MKHISIGLPEDKPDKAAISISPDLDFNTALLLLGTLSKHILGAYFEVASRQIENSKQYSKKTRGAATLGIKQSMYDTADSLFSNVLTEFYPDAPKLSIEDEAILELTNQKITERYDQLSDEEKAAYASTYKGVVDYVMERKARESSSEQADTDEDSKTTEG